MNIWSKIVTAMSGGINEAGESIVDSQALRILDQEIRDAAEDLNKSKDGLAALIAQQKLAEEKVTSLKQDVKENEAYIVAALEKQEDNLAEELAGKVADLEGRLESEQNSAISFKTQADELRSAIKLAESQIKRLKQQTETVKATEAVQRAQKVVAERHSGSNSKLRTALDSLERVKEKQKLTSAQLKASAEMAQDSGSDSLDTRLKEAGIKQELSAADVLARIKSKNKLG